MSDWYKMNPVDWNEGTNGLTLEQEAAYLRICNAIYIAGGPISNNQFVVAGLLRCNDRKAKRLVGELVEAGKITIEDGSICNRRALDEVSNRNRLSAERQSAGSRGGAESAKKRSNSLENKDTGQAIGARQNEPDKSRVDKNTEPNGSGAKAPAFVSQEDARETLFRECLPLLARYIGKPEASLRGLLGKWLKKSGDDALRVSRLIAEAVNDRRAEPVAWIEGCLKSSGHPKGKFIIRADGTVHKEDEHTGQYWLCHDIQPHQVEKIAIRDHRKREAA